MPSRAPGFEPDASAGSASRAEIPQHTGRRVRSPEHLYSGTTPYAVVSQATGAYAVIEGEVYQSSDGRFITIEVELGVLRLPLDEEAEPITVAENRTAAVSLHR